MPLLILDLDETLIFGADKPLERAPAFDVGPYHIYLRPHVFEFFDAIPKWFKIAVWTSAGPDYASQIVEKLIAPRITLEFVWSYSRCTQRYDPEMQSTYSVKNLRKIKQRLGYSLDRILAIDGSPEKLHLNYGNHIRVMPFLGDETDTELRDLLPYLEWIRSAQNFRTIEKRRWRLDVANLPRDPGG